MTRQHFKDMARVALMMQFRVDTEVCENKRKGSLRMSIIMGSLLQYMST
jgi:hypothetical protein